MVVAAPVLGAVALADRVLIIEDGRIAWDIDIDLKRRRERGSADVAALEGDYSARIASH